MVMIGVLFILSIQPMMIIMSMIITVLIYSLFLMWLISTYWYSYMLVLVLMSGVMVVFTYMMSVLPNESFEISSLVFLILGMILLYKSSEYEEFLMDSSMGSMKIWVGMTLTVSLFLVTYLFMIMIMIVWISMMEKGAIRIS